MSAPANVLTFWAEAHWGTGYGVIDAAHKYPGHKGLDCGLFHGIVQVPALYAGTVVAVEENSNVGHYVQVQRHGVELFDTYCHIVPGVRVGQTVSQGTDLGRQAITPAEGGIQWAGQHTHLALSNTMAGWGVWGPHNLDPTPGVIAVLTSTAGSGGTPFDNTTTTSTGEDTMRVIRANTGDIAGAIVRTGELSAPRPYGAAELSIALIDAKLHNPLHLYSNAGAGNFWIDVSREEFIVEVAENNARLVAAGHPAALDEDALVAKIVAALPAPPAGTVIDMDAITKDVLDTLHDRIAA